jgi:hypothetical protein
MDSQETRQTVCQISAIKLSHRFCSEAGPPAEHPHPASCAQNTLTAAVSLNSSLSFLFWTSSLSFTLLWSSLILLPFSPSLHFLLSLSPLIFASLFPSSPLFYLPAFPSACFHLHLFLLSSFPRLTSCSGIPRQPPAC